MKQQSIGNPLTSLTRLLVRYNFVILVILVSVGLSASVLILNNILTQPYKTSSSSQTTSTIFDQSAINQVTSLETSSSNTVYKNLPTGDRVNPFYE